MQKNRFCELTVISRFDLWRNCSSKSPFLPRFLIFRPWFLHQECGANLKNGWLCVHKHSTWNYFPSDEEILNIRSVFMQKSRVKPKRLVDSHHVVSGLVNPETHSPPRLFAISIIGTFSLALETDRVVIYTLLKNRRRKMQSRCTKM